MMMSTTITAAIAYQMRRSLKSTGLRSACLNPKRNVLKGATGRKHFSRGDKPSGPKPGPGRARAQDADRHVGARMRERRVVLGLTQHQLHVTGSALTMEVSRGALQESPRLRTICQAHARAFLGQVLQTIACHMVHTLEQRCARSLLMIHDRSNGDTLALRQELLAQMLGVGPPTAAALTRTLQKAGLIRYCQGDIRVLDRAGLQSAACECYRIDRERYQRLLPGAFARRDRARSG
jgi:hypothetical protein